MSVDDFGPGDGFDRDGLPVGDDAGGAAFHRPVAEPFVDPSFPDSTYDADPDFGRSRPEHDRDDGEGHERYDAPDEGDGLGPHPGTRVPTSDWVAGDLADVEREAHRIRLRLDPTLAGDRSGVRAGADRDRAGTFAEGARRVTKASYREADGAGPLRLGELVGRALEPRVGGADLSVSAMPTSITSLRTGAVSVTFHIPFEQAEQAWEFHKMQGKSVRVDVYLEDG